MHASTDLRLVKCLDGLHYSFALLEHAYDGLHQMCAAINTDRAQLVPVLSKCWMFVDLVHRIRELAQAIPGLSGKTKELRSFVKATQVAESFRHYIQHLRGELSKTEVNPFPVWGTLSWVDGDDSSKSHTAVIGASLPRVEYAVSVFDTHQRKWVSTVSLAVGNLSFNFDPIFEACCQFRDFVMPWLMGSYSPGITMVEDITIITIGVQDREKPGAGGDAEGAGTT